MILRNLVPKVFGQILSSFKQQLNLDSLFVADSALYTANNLEIIKNLKWLSRVPLGVKQAKNLISQLTEAEFVSCRAFKLYIQGGRDAHPTIL